MSDSVALAEKIQQEILELPQETLPELERFIEFLRFRSESHLGREVETDRLDTTAARSLRGILKGYDFSPEFIAEARKDMWRRFHVEDAP